MSGERPGYEHMYIVMNAFIMRSYLHRSNFDYRKYLSKPADCQPYKWELT